MGGLKAFQIALDNPVATFYGGQVVSGRIIVKLDEEKNMRGIEIRMRGQAEVEWKESKTVRNSNGKSHTVWHTYRGQENYFENRRYVVGSASGEMVLPVGEHIFPFSMTLPQNLPSSFEGKYGNVRYTIKATMDRPWKFDHEAKVAFTVIQHLDLNAERGVNSPVQNTEEKYLCCCCCKSGPITMVVSVPVRGYVPGQEIPVTVEIDNITNETIQYVSCELVKRVKFHASHSFHDKTRNDDLKVVEVGIDGVVPAQGSGCWTKKVRVPPVPPSYLKFCNIIDISYDLKVKGCISGMHSDMKTYVTIVIGTIPLISDFPNIMPATAPMTPSTDQDLPPSFGDVVGKNEMANFNPGWNVGPNGPYPPAAGGAGPYAPSYPPAGSSAPSAPFDPNPPYPEMPPPNYEEYMMGKTNIKESEDNDYIQGDMGFAPRYPTYQFNK